MTRQANYDTTEITVDIRRRNPKGVEMSFVSTQPESLATAAGDLRAIGSDMAAQNAASAVVVRDHWVRLDKEGDPPRQLQMSQGSGQVGTPRAALLLT
ncbi:PE family protein [Mycobacterium kansasii 662]|uniref:PE family protein n=2 Tax=Mycobacterium kansasii TaxID=1768 RepID=A0A1V3XU41_MYCKA|nr:PE family protein [Mycobacterium kansasii 824]EUA20864.1 PE family protein [Mycobacterium kansasii 662]KEP42644.1 hypothetical protein MKSMC1_21980 [Mycobacterium kansasii]OOK82612.1 PE family protein [Mycobacterium kansasii]OOK83413.1 PE family protein [Mycobacterium kansasii]